MQKKKDQNKSGQSLCNTLRKLRLQARLTQEELAAKLNVSPTSIHSWEKNPSTQIKKMNLIKLANTFNITIDQLLEETKHVEEEKPLSKLKKLRVQTGMSQSQFASKISISCAYLSQLENNPLINPNKKVLQKIANALRTKVTEFWDDPWNEDSPTELTKTERILLRAYKQLHRNNRLKLLKLMQEFEKEENEKS